jgi:S1-C subfamily serine protease
MVELSPAIASQRDLPVDEGALIVQVVPGSPAAAAGLQENDVITRIQDQKVETASDVSKVINASQPGDRVELTIARGSETTEVTATLAERPRQR